MNTNQLPRRCPDFPVFLVLILLLISSVTWPFAASIETRYLNLSTSSKGSPVNKAADLLSTSFLHFTVTIINFNCFHVLAFPHSDRACPQPLPPSVPPSKVGCKTEVPPLGQLAQCLTTYRYCLGSMHKHIQIIQYLKYTRYVKKNPKVW